MGSLLYERGVYVNRNFDELNLSQPELIYKLHREYLLAGAHMVESNTYGANPLRLARHGLGDRFVAINEAAVKNARRAVDEAAYVAGSIGPTGLAPGDLRQAEAEVRRGYSEQAQVLADQGVDVLVVETFTQPAELRLALEAARACVSLPVVAQIVVDDDGAVADGTPLDQLAQEMRDWGADAVGVNCNGPEVVYNAVLQMLEVGSPVVVMPNAGRPRKVEDRLIYLATPENFGVYARRLFKAGVKMVGGCCGTNPDHIRRVAAAARMVHPRREGSIQVSTAPSAGRPAVPLAERSEFGAQLGRRFVVSVEVNPGHGLDTGRPIEAARRLLKAGADVINIADGPRATARMSNLALAVEMRRELGNEVLLHVCCRDRNLLGLQATILSGHVLGVRNLVVITGDPPKVGDYPDATAVYDIDSIGLLRMCNGYNRGLDPAGKPMDTTRFVLATGAEPGATDFEREMLRLEQKVEAGANLIMTQPIYDPAHMERFLEASQKLAVPVLVGILPLASYRNAEFVHNNIPGMSIPEAVRDRMRAAGKGAAARAEGVRIAVESLMGVRERVAGAYIMPPLGRYEMAEEILHAIGDDRHIAPGVPGAVDEATTALAG